MEWLVLLFLFFAGKSPRRANGGPPSENVGEAWRKRIGPLLARARSGARWVPLFTSNFEDGPSGAAAGRWVGIESGGNPLASTKLHEYGLAQVMVPGSASELGLSDRDIAAMKDPKTPDVIHAAIAAKVMRAEVRKASARLPGVKDWGAADLALGKLRHGLPLMLRELAEQDLLLPSLRATVVRAAQHYKPSERAAKYARGAHELTGNRGQDLVLRFLAPAAVVAFAEDAVPWLDGGANS